MPYEYSRRTARLGDTTIRIWRDGTSFRFHLSIYRSNAMVVEDVTKNDRLLREKRAKFVQLFEESVSKLNPVTKLDTWVFVEGTGEGVKMTIDFTTYLTRIKSERDLAKITPEIMQPLLDRAARLIYAEVESYEWR